MRKRRKKFCKKIAEDYRSNDVHFWTICHETFSILVKGFEEDFKEELLNEIRDNCQQVLASVLTDRNEMTKFFDFHKEEGTLANRSSFQDWRNLPEQTIDPEIYEINQSYRNGVLDALKMFELEVLCMMQEIDTDYQRCHKELKRKFEK